ncbi:predicted protein [Candida tropicalis MYA-3404]|uniref:Uncharacterized protein n=1 Tax=Candida tropicalis (strain ATCC MYA-3404 / T1) TaxID=294747 RepID=C5M5M8_CANTT|nr:predicted protein [Candida tropicalis MYA-3404]EER34298.1 predicted protein [Candida tropicalis MYA-3404]KAG4408164.1 hypothetical protein JTP64_001470 [Candida tropicalis]MCP8718219.1 hypothetical protein [Asgard group archaeon]
MIISILILWLSLFSVLAITSKPKPNAPETDVNALVYFNQVFDMVKQQTAQDPIKSTNNNSTIPLITIEKPKSNTSESVDAQLKKGKLKPKWEYNAGIYLEKKINKKLMKKMLKNKDKFRALTDNDSGLVLGTTEKVLIPTELMVSRAIPDTHNLFHQNLTSYPKKQTMIKVHNIKRPQVAIPQSESTTYLYYDNYNGIQSDNYSSSNRLVRGFCHYLWWVFLYVL